MTTRYTVMGRGRFPMDMLRRDQAYPATPEDACTLARSFEDYDTTVEITLISNLKAWQIGSARWESFGWEVISNEVTAWDMRKARPVGPRISQQFGAAPSRRAIPKLDDSFRQMGETQAEKFGR